MEVGGERIDGDIAPGQVRLEARPPEVGQVDLDWRRPGQDHARHAVRLAERNERAPEPIREAASHRTAPLREGEVDVVKRPREQEIPDRATDKPGRSTDRLGNGHERRSHRIVRSECHECHDAADVSDASNASDGRSARRGIVQDGVAGRRGTPSSRYRAALNSFTSVASNSTSTFGPLDGVSSKLSFPAKRLGSSALALSAAGRSVPECCTF